jgi:proton-coupled amino acid transporter
LNEATIKIKTMDEHPSTYIAGEDNSRLQRAAADFGLSNKQARVPNANVRALQVLLTDATFETARMHSVGTLGNDEHLDDHGNVHMTLTVTRRKRQRKEPVYDGNLQNLFRQGPTPSSSGDGQEEEEVEEEEIIDVVEGGSLMAAAFGIIKGTIGPAVLFLPRGFKLAGFAVAIPCMVLATVSYIYSANRLLQCWRVEKEKATKLDEIRALLLESPKHYGSMPNQKEEGKLLTYPELAKRAFGRGSVFVQLGIALMQFGVCLT